MFFIKILKEYYLIENEFTERSTLNFEMYLQVMMHKIRQADQFATS